MSRVGLRLGIGRGLGLGVLLVAFAAARAWAGDPTPEPQPADPSIGSLLTGCCCSFLTLAGAGAAGFMIFNRVSGPLVEAGLGASRGPRVE